MEDNWLQFDVKDLEAVGNDNELIVPEDKNGFLNESKKTGGRKKKPPRNSPHTAYSPDDVVSFIRQVEFYPQLYDRLDARALLTEEKDTIWQSIETSCTFLKAPNHKNQRGTNAHSLWTNLVSELKKEKRRLECIPEGTSLEDVQVEFLYFLEMDFMMTILDRDAPLTSDIFGHIDGDKFTEESSSAPCASSSGQVPIQAIPRKRKAEESCTTLDRLLALAEKKCDERVPTTTSNGYTNVRSQHQDLFDALENLINSVPESDRFILKTDIYTYVREQTMLLGRQSSSEK